MNNPHLLSRSSIPRTATSIESTDSENTAICKEVARLYESAMLPSLFEKGSLSTFHISKLDSTFVEILLGDDESEVDPNTILWDSECDPENPMHWPTWKKTLNIAIIWLMCFISPFASSVLAPAIASVVVEFQEDDVYLSALVVSIYVLGYAIGPLFIGPLSEMYGRVVMYHICSVVFVLFTSLCGVTQSLEMLAAMRFFAGCGGSSIWTLAPASIADLVPVHGRGKLFALIGLAYNLGPAVSPMVGSHVKAALGWRWIFWLTAITGGVYCVASFVGLSETYEPVLLRRKARRLREETGNEALRSRLDVGMSRRRILTSAILRPLTLLFSPDVSLVSLLTAVGYAFLYILYTIFPTTFAMVYGWRPENLGYAYLGIAVGNLFGMLLGGGISDAIVKRRATKGDARPENRLLPMIFCWPLVSAGLFLYGWSAGKALPWIVPLVGSAIFGAGAMATIFFCSTYIVDAYTVHSASALAASSFVRSLVGGLVPLFANKLYVRYDTGWAFSILAFIALGFVPTPFLLYRYGERLRTRCNMSR